MLFEPRILRFPFACSNNHHRALDDIEGVSTSLMLRPGKWTSSQLSYNLSICLLVLLLSRWVSPAVSLPCQTYPGKIPRHHEYGREPPVLVRNIQILGMEFNSSIIHRCQPRATAIGMALILLDRLRILFRTMDHLRHICHVPMAFPHLTTAASAWT